MVADRTAAARGVNPLPESFGEPVKRRRSDGQSGRTGGQLDILERADLHHELTTDNRGTNCGRAAMSTTRLSYGIADLAADDGWDDAFDRCEVVLHVASPMSAHRNDAGTIVTEAVEGTLRVLELRSDLRSGRASTAMSFVGRPGLNPDRRFSRRTT